MGQFVYIARDTAGQRVTGTLDAESAQAAARALDEQQLFPVQVSAAGLGLPALSGLRQIRARQVGVFYSQLADLLGSGVPMLRALGTVGRALGQGPMAVLVQNVSEDVAKGSSLADAMTAHKDAFPPLHIAMIRAGEHGSFLEEVLSNLAAFIERLDELRGRVRGALIYPILLCVFGTVVVNILLLWLVPQFVPMFQGMPLPFPTRVLFYASGVLRAYWPAVLIVVIAAVVVGWRFLRSEGGKRQWERWRLKLPVVGRVMSLVAITRFCRILGTMLDSGVPILQALGIAKDATGSVLLSGSIQQAAENVRGGRPLTEPLRSSGLFPVEVVEMIAVAEESNQLEKVLVHIADTVERRTNRQVDLAVRLIEPLVLTVLAGVIGFVAVGLFYPILNMARTLK